MPCNNVEDRQLKRLLKERQYIQQCLIDIGHYTQTVDQNTTTTHLQVRLDALEKFWTKYHLNLEQIKHHPNCQLTLNTFETEEKVFYGRFFQVKAFLLNHINELPHQNPEHLLNSLARSTDGTGSADILEQELTAEPIACNTLLKSWGLSTTVSIHPNESTLGVEAAKGSTYPINSAFLPTSSTTTEQIDTAVTIEDCCLHLTNPSEGVSVGGDSNTSNDDGRHSDKKAHICIIEDSNTNLEYVVRSLGEHSQNNISNTTEGKRKVANLWMMIDRVDRQMHTPVRLVYRIRLLDNRSNDEGAKRARWVFDPGGRCSAYSGIFTLLASSSS